VRETWAEETEAAAAKTAGQQDSRSGPEIRGPSRFAVVAAVAHTVADAATALVHFRWAMPRSRKVAAMEKYQSPKEQERKDAPEFSRPGTGEAGDAVTAMEKAPDLVVEGFDDARGA